MLSVEAAVEALAELVFDSLYGCRSKSEPIEKFKRWDQEFLLDMDQHVKEQRAVSTAQAAIILKLIAAHRELLEGKGFKAADLDALLANPHYRRSPYQSTIIPREVRWAGDNLLAFRSKMNPSIIEAIKKLKSGNPLTDASNPYFNKVTKLWVVTVTLDNFEEVMKVIQRHKFAFDSDVEQLFLRVANSPVNRGSVDVEANELVVETSTDFFMDWWIRGIMRLEGRDV